MSARKLSHWGAALAISGCGAIATLEPSPASAEVSQAANQCAGVDAEAQTASFTSWAGVSEAKRLTRVEYIGKAPMHRTAGVQLFVPARAGMSAEYIQRLIGCQIALAAEQGGQEALGVPGIRAEVAARGDGYRVRITSDDVSAAQELVRRMGL